MSEEQVISFSKQRAEICGACDKQVLKYNVRICSECSCPIWSKTKIKSATCPLNKWTIEEQ
jgi:hypothetical protein